MEKEFLTVEQLCQWLNISRRTSERWRKAGMPFIKQGSVIRFDRKAVTEWLKSKEVKN